MTVKIHPRTRQRYSQDKFSGKDIQLDLKGPAALSQESVPVIGGYKDYTGSGGVPTKQLMFMPVANELEGTDAALEGAKKAELDVLGNRKRFTRLRPRKEII